MLRELDKLPSKWYIVKHNLLKNTSMKQKTTKIIWTVLSVFMIAAMVFFTILPALQ
jgi:hypothetical protein